MENLTEEGPGTMEMSTNTVSMYSSSYESENATMNKLNDLELTKYIPSLLNTVYPVYVGDERKIEQHYYTDLCYFAKKALRKLKVVLTILIIRKYATCLAVFRYGDIFIEPKFYKICSQKFVKSAPTNC
ncbi:hypothetical protein DPMN_068979 [Dreissena polymorpha]|uniref:Uncharacterized protein n=1 Tax=Dreissena polymorpha TaxID=45954 RepID=A0A9D4BMN7_DREPO|nr:hypothetical protein DPMN_068979 [Dreissena polymorpha]